MERRQGYQRGMPRNGPNSARARTISNTESLNGRPNKDGAHRGTSPSSRRRNSTSGNDHFVPYLSEEEVDEGLANGTLIQGELRVNPRHYDECYVDNPEDDKPDFCVLGMRDRNRALHGDIVVVRIKERKFWIVRDSDSGVQCSACVNLNQQMDCNGEEVTTANDTADGSTTAPMTVAKFCEAMESAKSGGVAHTGYSRHELIRLGFIMEEKVREKEECIINDAIVALTEKLCISREVYSPTGFSDLLKELSKRIRNGGDDGTQTRSNYRTVGTFNDEAKALADAVLQKTVEVVYIKEKRNSRIAVGTLKVMADGSHRWALFSPNDSRFPRMMIPASELPNGFFIRPKDFEKYIYVAKMVDWPHNKNSAKGELFKSLGLAGDVEAETEGILLSNNVDTREFSESALSSLPISEASKWSINEDELKKRRDFRDELVFTIDPATARDLDDALHVKPIADCDGEGTPGYEVGVHIADVTYFVNAGTELDHWASDRSTSVYLVHKVIPMLPRILCEELCSLNPGVERLTFSVVWKMNEKGDVQDVWFGRSLIRSACKLSYEHAQDFIDDPCKEFSTDAFPEIFGGRKLHELRDSVARLFEISKFLREKRFAGGALCLEQPQISFTLDDAKMMPNGVSVFERKESHSLIEEFMLLANMAVANRIESCYAKTALLRRHPPPKTRVFHQAMLQCKAIGFELEGSSSGSLARSLHKLEGTAELQRAASQVVSHLVLKSMQLAVYFCAGSLVDRDEFRHYALSVPLYTHFTSPIRRYADIVVHRQLSAALGYSPEPLVCVKDIQKIAGHCNERKSVAEAVSEASEDLFFGVFIKVCGPLEERGVVMGVLNQSFDVLVLKFGIVKRVYINRLEMAKPPFYREFPLAELTLYWKNDDGEVVEQVIRVCTVVTVILSALPNPPKYQALIKKPGPGEKNVMLADVI